MTANSGLHRDLPAAARLAAVLGLCLVVVAPGTSPGVGIVAAQGQNACGLLMKDEIQALALKDQIGEGVAITLAPDASGCRYVWGVGARRYTLGVSVTSASRQFVGMSADAIRQSLLSSVVPETIDAPIPEVGQAAVFKSYSAIYVGASAYLKDRILQVNLDGIDAREKKGELISLLKAAASRL